jgi:hypothetical protein
MFTEIYFKRPSNQSQSHNGNIPHHPTNHTPAGGRGIYFKRPSDQSQSHNGNVPHHPTNHSPTMGIYRTIRPITYLLAAAGLRAGGGEAGGGAASARQASRAFHTGGAKACVDHVSPAQGPLLLSSLRGTSARLRGTSARRRPADPPPPPPPPSASRAGPLRKFRLVLVAGVQWRLFVAVRLSIKGHSGHIQGTFSQQSGNIRHSGNIHGTFSKS